MRTIPKKMSPIRFGKQKVMHPRAYITLVLKTLTTFQVAFVEDWLQKSFFRLLGILVSKSRQYPSEPQNFSLNIASNFSLFHTIVLP